jgi:transposase
MTPTHPIAPIATQVWLVIEPVDMRIGIDGLSQRIQHSLGRSPCDGTAYAFRNRRQTRVKLLVWDGTGVWLCQRRLHRGHFTWPASDAITFTLTSAQWTWLTTGIDWQRLSAAPPANWQV